MNVKIQCGCGTKFSFDVEPVNGRMPVDVTCPGCNASALDLANAEIRRQLAAASAPAPTPAPAAAPQAPSIPRLTVPPSSGSAAPVFIPQVAAPQPMPSIPQPAAPQPQPSLPAASVPQPPMQSSLRIARPAAPHAQVPAAPAPAPAAVVEGAAATAEPTETQRCHKHKTEPAAAVCVVCNKPICLKCMELFGYVCSAYCRQQAAAKRINVPVYAHHKAVAPSRSSAKFKKIAIPSVALVVVFLGVWFWYAWFARDPKVIYSLDIPKSETHVLDDFYQLIGPGQLLSIKNKQLILYDVEQQKQLWTAHLESEAEAAAVKAARAKNEAIMKMTPKRIDPDTGEDRTRYPGLDPMGYGDDYLFTNPRVIVTTNDLWLLFSQRLARFDKQTGSAKLVAVPGEIRSIVPGENEILVVSGEPSGREVLSQITLPDGALQSEEIKPAKAKPEDKTKPAKPADKTAKATNQIAVAKGPKPANQNLRSADIAGKPPVEKLKGAIAATQTAAPSVADDESDAALPFFDELDRSFIPAGPNAVQMKTTMLEQKTIAHEAMKAKTKSVLESGTLTAGQSMEATQEMLNDMRRAETGGKEIEDVSRYQVTLHRWFANGIADWTGEVTGPPQIFALKTLDVITAGNSVLVFDKNNKKLWEGKLTYAVGSHDIFEPERSPCLETKDALYVADRGMLTCFDHDTGNVRWRLNSVGISRVQEGPRGKIYVDTTSAGADAVLYSQQINLSQKVHPVVLQVDPKTGKVLWRLQGVGDQILLSGKFVYATMVSQTLALLKLEEGPDTHFNVNLLNPSNGGVIWNYHQGNRHIQRTDVQQNWVLLHFDDGLVVLKFFSL